MKKSSYLPIFELARGGVIESIHYGSIAIVDVHGGMVASYADPDVVAYLRSTAKPFQALPFIEMGGHVSNNLSPKEIAVMCGSHSGTDEHVSVVRSMQAKSGVSEDDLLCGVHDPIDKLAAEALLKRNEKPTPIRHNCSGKHTGMLMYLKMKERSGESIGDLPYIDCEHPIQKEILHTFSEMCNLAIDQVRIGIDGCSAPIFAVPLRNTAYAYARLSDPEMGGVSPVERVKACREITSSMMGNPDMVGGPGRFDTRLMETGKGRIVSKGGAEGFLGMGLMPGALGPASPAMGVAIKISDGDRRGKVCASVALEVLRQLNVLSPLDFEALSDFGPRFPVQNWRKINVGEAYPTFELVREV